MVEKGDAPVSSGALQIADQYWSADERTYYVELAGVSEYQYCKVHLTKDGRRTGEWGNELWTRGARSSVTIDILYVEHAFDAVKVECS